MVSLMFHAIQLQFLVEPNPVLNSPKNQGVLKDGHMFWGIYHGTGRGVYCYSNFPEERFQKGDGWVLLELVVPGYLTKVSGHADGRYVLKCSKEHERTPCPIVEVVALHAIAEDGLLATF